MGIKYNAVLDVTFTGESVTEPVTVAEAKAWMRVDGSDDDTLIGKIIKASRRRLERATNTSFIARTVNTRLHNGLGEISLPYGPVIAVTAIIDYDDEDIETDDYAIRGSSFRVLDTDYNDYVTLTYTAGYADGSLPEDMREDLLNQIAWAYMNRGDEAGTKLSPDLKLSYSRR